MTDPSRTGGRTVVETLVAVGIRHAFTVPGESFLGLLDALRGGPIRTIATRHEGGAGFMAEAVGQLTGRPATCLVTRAVGAANLAIALHTARQDSSPLVAIVGGVPRAFHGREAFQEVDQVATFGRLCKAAVEVDDPERLAVETARLVAIARSGRPGPVLIAVPEDVLDAAVSGALGEPHAEPERPAPTTTEVDAVLAVLASARSPVVVAGAGVLRSGAEAELLAFAEAVEVPVIASWRRPDVFPNYHRLYLGMSGLSGPHTVRERLQAADVLLAVGTRLSEIATFGYAVPTPPTRLVHVDIEPGFAGDRPAPAIAVRADAAAFLRAAAARAAARTSAVVDGTARRIANDMDRAAYVAAIALPDLGPAEPRGVHPATVARALRALLPEGAILTTDAGNFAGWAARHLPIPPRGRFLGPTSGAMGYALPAAIGAAVAAPQRTVVALAGDGGFAMLMAELETAVRERLRLVALVHDNAMYGTIRMHQEVAHPGRVSATNLGPIDFAAVAAACGGRGLRVERDDEVAGALETALAADGVTVVHLLTDPRVLAVDQRLEA